MNNNYHTYAHTFRSYLVSVISLTLITFFSFGCSENTARSELKPIDVTQNLVQADQTDNIQTYQDPNLGLSFDINFKLTNTCCFPLESFAFLGTKVTEFGANFNFEEIS